MRLLLSLILTSFILLAPQNSDAAGVYGKKTVVTSSFGLSEIDVAGYSEYGHLAVTILHKSNVRNATNQHRSLPGIHPDYSSFHFAPVELLLPANRLEERYSYCIPIAMKLLFPKHYFW